MFNDSIRSTAMTSKQADLLLRNIKGRSFNGDVTFLSTLRALVCSRMNAGDFINLKFESSAYSENSVRSNSGRAVIKTIHDVGEYRTGDICIHNIHGSSADINANFEELERNFLKFSPGYERIEKVTDFFRKSFRSLCYINVDAKKVVIFAENLTMKKMHYLQCAIFAFLPWYFNPEDGVKEDEMNLINSLREKTSDAYKACIDKIAGKYNFREMYIKNSLKGVESKLFLSKCENLKREIRGINSDIRSYDNAISELLRKKRNADIELLGLKMKASELEDESEIMDYFLCNKRLFLTDVSDSNTVDFFVKDYVTYFDEDEAERIINNNNSYVYSRSSGYNKEDVKRLMEAIFIDQIFKLKLCAAYSFNIADRHLRPVSDYNFGSDAEDAIPNYHIQRFSCMGNYTRTINSCIDKNDYIGVFEQCVASCKSLNFSDSTVMEYFMGVFSSNAHKCIELPSGDVVTFDEAIKFLKEQEVEDEKKEVPETTVDSEVLVQESTETEVE